MLEYSVDHGRMKRLAVAGDMVELITDLSALIGTVHFKLKQSNPAAAEFLKLKLLCMLMDPESMVWNAPADAFDDLMAVTIILPNSSTGEKGGGND